uniref:F-box domain-containing protein n=1 Tax=Moniliophthora roreri TaxID=221103 RepID=A0A0W0EVY2_MONRR
MSFSQELVDLIIDELQDDENTLINLSLVSHAWLLRSRTYLFQELCLLPTHQRKLNNVKIWSGEDMELHIQTFIDLCSHPQSTIPNAGPKYIRLTPKPPYRTDLSPQDDRLRHKSVFLELLSWLSSPSSTVCREINDRTNTNTCNAERLFWNVRELRLLEFEPKNGLAHLNNILRLSPFPRVTHLYLCDVNTRSRKAFSDMLSMFPSLKYVYAGVWFDQVPIIQRPVAFPASLTYVEISHRTSQSLHPSLFRILEACATLKHLTLPINFRKESMFIEINQFLDTSISVKNRLLTQCKLVSHGLWFDRPTWARSINFQKVPNWTIEAHPGAFLTLGTEDLVLPNVKQVILQDALQRSNSDQLGQLDELFSNQTRFPGIQEVTIHGVGFYSVATLKISGWDERSMTVREGSEAHIDMETLSAMVRTMMPKCVKRGIFGFNFVYQRISVQPYSI